MVGRNCWMTYTLKELIREHCATRHVPFKCFHSVWCVAHRLNLVTRDFMGIKGINIIKAFLEWFSDRRRQTCYKRFLSQTNDGEKLRTIPQPSETRWFFYRDVIASIMSQSTFAEEFIKQHGDFQEFWSSLKTNKDYEDLDLERIVI